jgi:thiamine biosynthesis lipoprotein
LQNALEGGADNRLEMSALHDVTFRSMGCDVRLLIGEPRDGAALTPAAAATRERDFVEALAARLSRFRPDSELSALNGDPREAAPSSPLLRAAVGAGLWAAHTSGGLVDPTLVGPLERGGYASSLEGAEPASLVEALRHAPRRRPARPSPDALWRTVSVDNRTGAVRRPPGVRIDTGGTGKGLAADAVAQRLAGFSRFVVDCGGDIAIGGTRGAGAPAEPFEIAVEHPLTREVVHAFRVARGGVATSGLDKRIWRRPDGSFAHHLLDPASGEPAWTGLISATALGGSALEAETLSKQALLSGPAGARAVLARYGGVIVHDSGDVEALGPAAHHASIVGTPEVAAMHSAR